MKALGLWQPYAGLIRLNIKTIETRFWPTDYRGTILVCSTMKIAPDHQAIVGNILASGHRFDASELASTGCMECLVDIVDCRPGETSDEEAACCPLFDVNPKTGQRQQKHAFVLANVRPVVKKPVKCGRKWFNVDDNLIEVHRG